MTIEMTCPTYGSHDISKNGTTRRGKQNVIAQLSSQSDGCEVRAREIASKAEIPCRRTVFTNERT